MPPKSIYKCMKKKNVILGVTGSIAAYRAVDIVRALDEAGYCVDVVMTKAAKAFVTPLTLQTFSRRKVYEDMFAPVADYAVEHISLAQRASVVLVAPATAHIIGKIASGICDDLLTCVIAATKANVLIAPAMNEAMYKNAIVQENIAKLKRNGIHCIGPRKGKLACGDSGDGCLENIDVIVAAVKRHASRR